MIDEQSWALPVNQSLQVLVGPKLHRVELHHARHTIVPGDVLLQGLDLKLATMVAVHLTSARTYEVGRLVLELQSNFLFPDTTHPLHQQEVRRGSVAHGEVDVDIRGLRQCCPRR